MERSPNKYKTAYKDEFRKFISPKKDGVTLAGCNLQQDVDETHQDEPNVSH